LSVHAPYYINLASEEEEKISASKQRILKSAQRAHALKAKVVVFHPGYYHSEEETFELMKEACEDLSQRIEENSWEVKLGLETSGKLAQFGSLEEILPITREVGGCVPVLDFAHVYARNQGEVEWEDVLKRLNSPLHCHFSGIEYSDRGEKKHLPMEVGEPSFREVAREILNQEMEVTIISESPLLEKDSLRMREILEEIGGEDVKN